MILLDKIAKLLYYNNISTQRFYNATTKKDGMNDD